MTSPPASARVAIPGPKVVTEADASRVTETITIGPKREVERAPAGLRRHREGRRERVRENADRDGSEQERLQSAYHDGPRSIG